MFGALSKHSATTLLHGFLRAGLSLLFIYAAYQKLLDPSDLASSIDHYRVLPDALIGWAAQAVPAFEIVVAAGMLTPWLHRGSALLCAGMLWIFALAMSQARLRGINLECGCFGADSNVAVGVDTIARNVALGAAALWVALWPIPRPANNR